MPDKNNSLITKFQNLINQLIKVFKYSVAFIFVLAFLLSAWGFFHPTADEETAKKSPLQRTPYPDTPPKTEKTPHPQADMPPEQPHPDHFVSVKEMMENRRDFKSEDGTFKIIKKNPLHIQLSPSFISNAKTPNFDDPENMQSDVRRAIIYGIYRSFIHTDIQQITVTALPQIFNIDTKKTKYLKKYQITASRTRQEALDIVKKHINVNSFADLVHLEKPETIEKDDKYLSSIDRESDPDGYYKALLKYSDDHSNELTNEFKTLYYDHRIGSELFKNQDAIAYQLNLESFYKELTAP